MVGAKNPFLLLLLRLALAAPVLAVLLIGAPQRSGGGSGSSLLMLGRRAQPQMLAAGALFALEGAARTLGGCAAQNTAGTVKAVQKISNTSGNGPGLEAADNFGRSVASVGDVDGDSVPDIGVGAYMDDDGGSNCGAVHVLFLHRNGTVKSSQKISALAGGGPALDNSDRFGISIAGLGDLNGDSVPDICVGAYFDDDGGGANQNANIGAVYVLFLNSDGTVRSTQKISNAAGGLGSFLDFNDQFGVSIAAVGDLDSDTVTDICVGATYDDDGGTVAMSCPAGLIQNCNLGAVYVMFLNSDGTVKGFQKISATKGGFPTNALYYGDSFGASIASLGDLDGDAVTDICVGAENDDDGGAPSGLAANVGAVYVIFLNTSGMAKASQKISATAGGLNVSLANADRFGVSISAAGDLDGDAVTDICVGAYEDDDGGNSRGAVYMLFLNSNGTVKVSQKISQTAGGLLLNGLVSLDDSDKFGSAVASLGDLDGDGVADICVGAYLDDDGGDGHGAVYILFLNGNAAQVQTTGSATTGTRSTTTVTTGTTAAPTSANLTTTAAAVTTAVNATSASSGTVATTSQTSGSSGAIADANTGEAVTGLSDGALAGIFVGVGVLLVLVIIAGVVWNRTHRRSGNLSSAESFDQDDAVELGEELLDDKHIEYEDLEFDKKLAEGNFGEVWRGTWALQPCVIKKLKDTGEEARKELIREAVQLAQLRPCPAVCTFFGVSLDGPLPCVVLELIPGGELKKLLDNPDEVITGHDIAHMSMNLASGMEVLHARGILHLDLAARNLLVTGRNPLALRITDFGLSQTLPLHENFIPVPPGAMVPVKWADPDIFARNRFSKGSDVYSFGVCLWEMTARAMPWARTRNNQVVASLLAGEVLPLPQPRHNTSMSPEISKDLYDVMTQCWELKVEARPTFVMLRQRLGKLVKLYPPEFFADLPGAVPSAPATALPDDADDFYSAHFGKQEPPTPSQYSTPMSAATPVAQEEEAYYVSPGQYAKTPDLSAQYAKTPDLSAQYSSAVMKAANVEAEDGGYSTAFLAQ